MGLLGLLMLAAFGRWALHYQVDGADLARIYQAGFARSAVALIPASSADALQAQVLQRRLQRSDVVRAYDPERLRATLPFILAADGRFWPAANDIQPHARMDVRWDGAESGQLKVKPFGGKAWDVPLRSRGLVRPDWSAYSGLVAYYDLERVWIADVEGKKFQSLVQAPELDEGGVLKFSADGTALAFYFHFDGRWKAQDLYVLSR
jgi:hypothetical protein